MPDPSAGFQLRTQPVMVPPGTENQDCYFFTVPSAQDVYVGRFVMRQSVGSHHMNIFRVKTQLGLKGTDGTVVKGGSDSTNPCWVSSNWADWPLVVNTQQSASDSPTTEMVLPNGVADRFAPGELLMLQSHYVNATTQQTPGPAMVWVNFEFLPTAQVQSQMGTLFATNQNIKICPGEHKFFEQVCRMPPGTTIFGANGHFHSRGTLFTMDTWTDTGGAGQMFYHNTSWNEPLMAESLNVKVPDGGGLVFHCEFQVPPGACGDPAKDCCFVFGGKVETQEHCNAFVYYYPQTGTDIPCF